MNKKILGFLLTIGLSITSASAYDLKTNMMLLNAELSEVQQGFISSNMAGVNSAIRRFKKDAQELLGDEEKIKQMLPGKKKYKSKEAVTAAQIISVNTQIIIDAIENKYNHTGRKRREDAQRAYTYIEHACFRCHNIVRDDNK